jgi:uncharacterized iron-regulated membrane protein
LPRRRSTRSSLVDLALILLLLSSLLLLLRRRAAVRLELRALVRCAREPAL